jgi:hypothetical protein
MTSFNSNGFTTGTYNNVTNNNQDFTSWTFRKAPGFFDVVTWTGNSNNRTISHSLGSVPGCIIIKCTSASKDWQVGHRGTKDTDPWNWTLKLNSDSAAAEENGGWNDTAPTSSVFSLGTNHTCNLNGETYVAYLFAGGEGTTDKAVLFDNAADKLYTAGDSGFVLGTGDFTIEGWYKFDNTTNYQFLFDQRTESDNGHYACIFKHDNNHDLRVYIDSSTQIQSSTIISAGVWYHVALVRSSGTI